MKPGFETTCVCSVRLVWLKGTRGLVPVVRQYADRVHLDREAIDAMTHVNEHEHSTVYLKLKEAELLPA